MKIIIYHFTNMTDENKKVLYFGFDFNFFDEQTSEAEHKIVIH